MCNAWHMKTLQDVSTNSTKNILNHYYKDTTGFSKLLAEVRNAVRIETQSVIGWQIETNLSEILLTIEIAFPIIKTLDHLQISSDALQMEGGITSFICYD